MIFTLAWKEIREHQGVWITMVFMSIVLGLGLSKIVALGGDPGIATPVAALTILGMAATYGVVCGAMMLAGEHEGGTLVFLDIFHGRRGRLWTGKLAIGALLALTQAIAVAALLYKLQPESPRWLVGIIGQTTNLGGGGVATDPAVWFFVLPVVTLEAFFWGMLGSSFTQRVLAGAAIAAAIFTPVLLLALFAPPEIFVVLRIIAIAGCLLISFFVFVNQSLDGSSTPQVQPIAIRLNERKEHFLEQFDRLERDTEMDEDEPAEPVSIPVNNREPQPAWEQPEPGIASPRGSRSAPLDLPDAPGSPSEALWWLTRQQVGPAFWILGAASLFVGVLIVPINFQVLWPIATLLIGVVCGTAVFAHEQSSQSYQCLAAAHLPLRQIWRFKILFWLGLAVLVSLLLAVSSAVGIMIRSANQPLNFPGTFYGLFGPLLFLGIWLFYGFCTGQLIVWLCRKNILALLISTMTAVTAIGMWLPAIVCGGLSGWQMWVPPLTMLIATCVLVRAWAGGRIWERKPMAALVGYGAAILFWALVVSGYRAIEVPGVHEPLDTTAFRDSLPGQKDNLAAKAIHKALGEFGDNNAPQWLKTLDEARQLPMGVLEMPRSDGQLSALTHLPVCRRMADNLLARVQAEDTPRGLQHLTLVLMLSRNLRNKATLESYLAGVELEDTALNGFAVPWLLRRPDGALMQQAAMELNNHVKDTPLAIDCAKTECFRSRGLLANPATWTMAPGRDGRMREHWLANGIAVAMEAPWEGHRTTRIWRLVWSGQLRHLQSPHWELPPTEVLPKFAKEATSKIMATWLADPDGGPSRRRVARLLDDSWLADEQLFPNMDRLRQAASRSQWKTDAMRLELALRRYRHDHDKLPPNLDALAPRYLERLPTDPYSGKSYLYGNKAGVVSFWSTGPDGVDHGGLRDGRNLADGDALWKTEAFDLIHTVMPGW